MSKIYYNGKIITMENQTAAEELGSSPDAVLVEHGIIVATGTKAECQRLAPKARLVDLNGKCLMPSFIDPHGHMVMNGQMTMCAYLGECTCFDDIVNALTDFIKQKKITSKQAVMGFGYDHNFLKEYAQPDKRVLDRVSTEIPIMILHVSAHLACVNSAALKLAGVDESTPNPDGGVIGRLPDSKEPSGYLEEGAMMAFSQSVGKRIKKDIVGMFTRMQSVYLENGVTTIQDGASTKADISMLKIMGKLGLLKADVVAYPIMSGGGIDIIDKDGAKYRDYNKHLKIGGYKLVLDGSPQGRSAWMSEPYLGGEEGYCAYSWLKDEEVNEYALRAVKENRQLLAHCNGDAASEQFLNAYEKALAQTGNKNDLRPVMIHCQTVRNDQLDRMAKIDMIASIFVGHVWYWGDVHKRNFGEKRGNHISPVKDALDRGIHINFHQDTPVTKPYMLHSVWCAVNRLSRSGEVIGDDQRISVYDALKAVTLGGAYEYFEEDSKGSIKVGKRADLVILDKSPLEVEPMQIKDIRVLETIKDGRTVFVKRD